MDSLQAQLVNSLFWQSPELQQFQLQQQQQQQQHQQQQQQHHQQQQQQCHVIHQDAESNMPTATLTSPALPPHILGCEPISTKHEQHSSIKLEGMPSNLGTTIPISMQNPQFAQITATLASSSVATSPVWDKIPTSTSSPSLQANMAKDDFIKPDMLQAVTSMSETAASAAAPTIDIDECGSQSGGITGDGSGSPEPSSGEGNNKKRHRLRPEQTRRLMEVFEKTTKPDSEMRKALGKQLGMSPRTVQIWFQNRRAKLKRESNASEALRPLGFCPTGIYSNRGRLTYNRNFINRRHIGRVASEGFERFRSMYGYEPYPRETLRGLPLQNPSQVIIPRDVAPQVAMGGAIIHGHGNSMNQSAMGIPTSQSPTTAAMAAAAAAVSGGVAPTAAMAQMLNGIIPIGGNHPGIPQLSPQSCIQPDVLQLHNQNMTAPGDHDATRGRFRSFTVDSHSLANVGRIGQPHTSVNCSMDISQEPGVIPSGEMAASIGIQQQQQQQQHSPLSSQPLPLPQFAPQSLDSTEIPSAEALLQSRRRHLQDLMIINHTHAARGINTSCIPTSNGPSVPISPMAYISDMLPVNGLPNADGADGIKTGQDSGNSSIPGAGRRQPLLFSELPQSSPLSSAAEASITATSTATSPTSIISPSSIAATNNISTSIEATSAFTTTSASFSESVSLPSSSTRDGNSLSNISNGITVETSIQSTPFNAENLSAQSFINNSRNGSDAIPGMHAGEGVGGCSGVGAPDTMDGMGRTSSAVANRCSSSSAAENGHDGSCDNSCARDERLYTAVPISTLGQQQMIAPIQTLHRDSTTAAASSAQTLSFDNGSNGEVGCNNGMNTGQYQLLNDFLLQYNPFELLSNPAGINSEPRIQKLQQQTELCMTNGKTSEPLFGDDSLLANAVAAAYMNTKDEMEGSTASGSTVVPNIHNGSDRAGTDAIDPTSTEIGVGIMQSTTNGSFSSRVSLSPTIATMSMGNGGALMDTNLSMSKNEQSQQQMTKCIAANRHPLQLSLSGPGFGNGPQEKQNTNPVSVATGDVVGKQDIMIEQFMYQGLPF